MLTDPANDSRTWFWAHFYDDGEGVLTATGIPESGRVVLASNRICAIGKYRSLGFTPWNGSEATHRRKLARVVSAADMATFSYLNLNYLLYSCINVAAVAGLSNLRGVRSMYFTFASCSSLEEIDFRRFDPSTLTDLSYALSSCASLTTIYADASWALPTSGITGGQCFYSSKDLVGGNGTAWSSSNVSYTYMRIGKAGYLTALMNDGTDAERAARDVMTGHGRSEPKSQDGWVEGLRVLLNARDQAVKSCTSLSNAARSMLITVNEPMRRAYEGWRRTGS